MVYKVVWTPEALQTYLQVISYLEQKWTEREVKNFAKGVEDKIDLLKKFSGIGSRLIRGENSEKCWCTNKYNCIIVSNLKKGKLN